MPKPTPDLSEFEAIGPPNHHGGKCWFTRLTEDQQAKVNAAHAAGYNYKQIQTVVNSQWGIDVGSKTIGTHLTGACSCAK